MNKSEERLKKIKALALNGIDGEKENAAALLEQLTKKYGIAIGDLDEEKVEAFKIKVRGNEEMRLLTQIVYKVTNETGNTYRLRYEESKRLCKSYLSVHCTAAEKAEIDVLFAFFKRIWAKDKERLFEAFIHKHRIFGELKEGEAGMSISPEEAARVAALMAGLTDESPVKAIENR